MCPNLTSGTSDKMLSKVKEIKCKYFLSLNSKKKNSKKLISVVDFGTFTMSNKTGGKQISKQK